MSKNIDFFPPYLKPFSGLPADPVPEIAWFVSNAFPFHLN
jgi:hypothetical protein